MQRITMGESTGNLSRSELLNNLKGWAEFIAGAKAETEVKTVKKKKGLLGLFGESA
jgi:hypothetical protein